MALTEQEQTILQLNTKGLSDYQIAKKLNIETPNVYRAQKTALRKLEHARADTAFADELKTLQYCSTSTGNNSLFLYRMAQDYPLLHGANSYS